MHYIEVETQAEMVDFTCECGRRLRRPDLDDAGRVLGDPGRAHTLRDRSRARTARDRDRYRRFANYLVVEKRAQDAEEVARETAPEPR
jgi:hypothetical protein